MEAIFAERSLIRAVLIASGVPARDRADVEQQVLIGAWDSVRRGLYRPDPREDPRRALRGWIHGIAWRKVSHYFGSSWVRRAVLHAEPLGLLRDLAGPNLHAQVEARETLEVLTELPLWQLEALLVVDQPEPLTEHARRHGMNPATVASRLRIARKTLTRKLRRRG
ncbi:RNA polymerase sigma factor [Sorangium sp. So ce385]|uniref:RNA polymerase sigma factor n=1 Tax=Sorangium sp. So ce385 TaxID=3133308 RepID=UPI003F5C6272